MSQDILRAHGFGVGKYRKGSELYPANLDASKRVSRDMLFTINIPYNASNPKILDFIVDNDDSIYVYYSYNISSTIYRVAKFSLIDDYYQPVYDIYNSSNSINCLFIDDNYFYFNSGASNFKKHNKSDGAEVANISGIQTPVNSHMHDGIVYLFGTNYEALYAIDTASMTLTSTYPSLANGFFIEGTDYYVYRGPYSNDVGYNKLVRFTLTSGYKWASSNGTSRPNPNKANTLIDIDGTEQRIFMLRNMGVIDKVEYPSLTLIESMIPNFSFYSINTIVKGIDNDIYNFYLSAQYDNKYLMSSIDKSNVVNSLPYSLVTPLASNIKRHNNDIYYTVFGNSLYRSRLVYKLQ